MPYLFCFFFSSRRRHTRLQGDWSSDVCSSDLDEKAPMPGCRSTCRGAALSQDIGEIGRASCRESVDLGGRRIIKKKKTKPAGNARKRKSKASPEKRFRKRRKNRN